MTSADIGCTKPAAGVIATNPATAPEIAAQCARLALSDPLRHHPPHRRRRGAKMRGHESARGQTDRRRARVPALNPNQPTHSRHAPMKLSTTLCGGIGSPRITDALAQIQRAHQRRDAGRDVHHRSARKVQAWELAAAKHSAGRPCPTPCGPSGIHHERPQHSEYHHRAELHPLRERARRSAPA